MIADVIRPMDRQALRSAVETAEPFPFCCIDNFLTEDFAEEVSRSFPGFDEAAKLGRQFSAVNERGKIQITEAALFPGPIRRLHEALASSEWLDLVSDVMRIPRLITDPDLVGGGIHETGPGGHLDVHVDFNYIESRQVHRRLNILVYFNRGWRPEWGGNIELWDRDVKTCHHSFAPLFNRCVVFETSDISYHGVTGVTCPSDIVRRSFAGYYYTKEAPQWWEGEKHSTRFRARPDERLKKLVLMPAEKVAASLRQGVRQLRSTIVRP